MGHELGGCRVVDEDSDTATERFFRRRYQLSAVLITADIRRNRDRLCAEFATRIRCVFSFIPADPVVHSDIGPAPRKLQRRRPPDTGAAAGDDGDLRSEEHTSELQSLMRISYAVFCLKKK